MESKSDSAKESGSVSSTESGSGSSTESGSGSSEDSGKNSSDFDRGERQKPVTKSYRKNWDNVFGGKPRANKKK